MINHDIMRFNISMHNAFAMTKVKGLKEFVDVVTDIEVDKTRV